MSRKSVIRSKLPFSELPVVDVYRPQEAIRLYEEGRMCSPWYPFKEEEDSYETWLRHLRKIKAAFIVVQNGKKLEILKERRA